jgi:hypothetical protein
MPGVIPSPVRLFHITAIANLPSLCAAGALHSKNAGIKNGVNYQNIAHAGAQGARSGRAVPNPPGGTVHDYVPFYYAPRSPMLSAIHNGNVAGCTLAQDEVVHLEATVASVLANNATFVIFDRNATFPYAKGYTNLADLNQVAWDLILEPPLLDGFCKYFFDRPTLPRYVDRREKRMAEFLVHQTVPLNHIISVGVIDATRQIQVTQILQNYGIKLPVHIKPDWYF